MTGKTALGSIGAVLALFIAVRSPHQTVQAAASVVGSCLLGYTATTFFLDCKRQRKARAAHTEAYLEFLQQVRQQRSTRHPPVPATCQGCCHYHGQYYGGNFLVCGMHPYGVESEHCPDWEAPCSVEAKAKQRSEI
jgi:hypothetical protein